MGAFEIKLGANAIDDAARSLMEIRNALEAEGTKTLISWRFSVSEHPMLTERRWRLYRTDHCIGAMRHLIGVAGTPWNVQ